MAIAATIDIIFIVLTVTSPITYASASTASTQTLGLGHEQFQGRRRWDDCASSRRASSQYVVSLSDALARIGLETGIGFIPFGGMDTKS